MKKIAWLILIMAVIAASLAFYFLRQEKDLGSGASLSVWSESISQTGDFYDIQVEYPQFEGAPGLNESVSQLVLGKVDAFLSEVSGEVPFVFAGEWEPVQVNEKYASFVVNFYHYMGGAHGLNEIHAFNYDMKKKEEITIMDFINHSQEVFFALADLAKREARSYLQAGGFETDGFVEQMIESGTEPTAENYRNFNFNGDSLIIYFQQYQVAPGAAGPVTVVIDKNTLESNSIESDYLE
jgi:hypothetical protein